jgi:hypothetical protein
MNTFVRTIVYSLTAGGLVLITLLFFIGRSTHLTTSTPLPKDVVKNYDDCKSRGYQIQGEYNEQCRTPSGTIFLDLRAYVATSSTYTTPVKHTNK